MRKKTLFLLLLPFVACDGGLGPENGPPAAAVVLQPPAYSLIPGDTMRLSAVAFSADYDTASWIRLRWSTADPSIATVDSTGLAHARSPGTTEITVEADSVSDTATLHVIQPSEPCAAHGVVHVGGVTAPEIWERTAGPHHVPNSLMVQAMVTVEPGTTICMGEHAAFDIGPVGGGAAGLMARGTPWDSILITARTQGIAWTGVLTGPPANDTQRIRLSHVRLEHAARGILAFGAEAQVDSSLIRAIAGIAVAFELATGRVLDSVLDSVGTGVAIGYSQPTLTGILIRDAAGLGISAHRSSLRLRDVRIEGAGGTGIAFGRESQGATLVEARNVTIADGAGYPAQVNARAASILSDASFGNRLTGNARDTVLVDRYADIDGDTLVVRAGLPWRAQDGLAVFGTGALRLEPGATLVVGYSSFGLSLGVPLDARGTAEAPVTLIAEADAPFQRHDARLYGSTAQPHQVVHAEVRGMILVSDTSRPLRVDSSRIINGGLQLRALGSRVLATTLEGGIDSATVVLAARGVILHGTTIQGAVGHGIRVDSPDVTISSCSVTGNAGDGILVRSSAGVRITDCDLERNGGAGVRNSDAPPVDATFNWWGDPAGPLGPAGDGVAGPVLYTPFRTRAANAAAPSPKLAFSRPTGAASWPPAPRGRRP